MTEPNATISVSGEAELKVVPDQVQITLGIETIHTDLAAAKAESDARLKRVLAVAKEAGVADGNVATDYLNVEPKYEWEGGRNVFKGYTVRRSLVVTMRELAKFDAVLTETLRAGANYVQNIQFSTTELRKHRDEVRKVAVRAAREKAVALASELGATVGKPVSISEGRGGFWSGYGLGWGRSDRYGGMTQNVMVQSAGEAPEGTTAPGTIGVKAEVTVIFELGS